MISSDSSGTRAYDNLVGKGIILDHAAKFYNFKGISTREAARTLNFS